MSGKGSAPRPYSVDQKTFDQNWETIFGKKSTTPPNQTQPQSEDKNDTKPRQ